MKSNSQEAGTFENDKAAHELTIHLEAIRHFEKEKDAEKVLKHMEGFQLLLDHQRYKLLICKKAYTTLIH